MSRSASSEKTIWVLAGTTEGKEAVTRLMDDGFRVVATTATEQGAKLVRALGSEVRVECGHLEGDSNGRIHRRARCRRRRRRDAPICRSRIPTNARRAAEERGIRYLRFERPGIGSSEGSAVQSCA